MAHENSDDDALEQLRIERRFASPPADIWPWLADSAKTAEWIGPWHFVDEAEGLIALQLVAEEGAPASSVRVLRCEAPSVLEVETNDDAGSWHLRVRLEPCEVEGPVASTGTLLVFEHLDLPAAMLTDITAGWDFYLDTMIAAREGRKKPEFEDYLRTADES